MIVTSVLKTSVVSCRMMLKGREDMIALVKKNKNKLVALTLAVVLTACSDGGGSGGGIGGTGKQVIQDGLIIGSIDGFGSIVINDQRFETDDAKIYINGNEAVLSDLRIGMNMIAGVDTIAKTANELQYRADVSGPVQSVNGNRTTFTLLGQTVVINDVTVFDGLVSSQLNTGLLVQVSGNRNAADEIVASYVSLASEDSQYFTVGTVERANPSDSARIAGALIDAQPAAVAYGLTLENFEALFLVDGTEVRVYTEAGAAPAVSASDSSLATLSVVAVEVMETPAYKAGDIIQILGILSVAENTGSFVVQGFEVMVDGETEAVTSFDMPMEFPDAAENREVLINGIADEDNGAIVISVIKFLDEI